MTNDEKLAALRTLRNWGCTDYIEDKHITEAIDYAIGCVEAVQWINDTLSKDGVSALHITSGMVPK